LSLTRVAGARRQVYGLVRLEIYARKIIFWPIKLQEKRRRIEREKQTWMNEKNNKPGTKW